MSGPLVNANELAARSAMRFEGESGEYRAARTALLAEEIELRRSIERVAAQRRMLLPGPVVRDRYRFRTAAGELDLAGLFGIHDTLIMYSWMFGPQREAPCPMCTNLIAGIASTAKDTEQRAAVVVVARSPLEKVAAFAAGRGWRGLMLAQDLDDGYSREWGAFMPDGEEVPALNVFTRADGVIRLFWAGEMGGDTMDPGQDPRGAPDLQPLWAFLDMTPAGRGADWYPSLDYPNAASTPGG
ncbi:hypothetical protein GCM10011529_00810 [Polymorphobacter glacialis]|uniref:DUF899 domain-containing protein n=1 Tax=Sandarakinorhabdus glacialis TaxID=1614636 RepID=A0A916ZHR6_9SPHN|nr:DUF899 family protein [Polymorphobacter glacialis]GGD98600.1 hypothetical protein GCM10011529_00810 [Polymorphobacter glacialis]